jgi:ATP adenylyltransferase
MERIWAGWRNDYVSGVANVAPVAGECVFCAVFAADADDRDRLVVHRSELVVAMLNLYPYGSGHMLVMPIRHMPALSDLTRDERVELFDTLTDATTALGSAYAPDGMNVGANLGRAAGAGIPGHLHLHALPRWAGDTNFITTVGNARVINEDLATSYEKIRDAWPN